MERSSDLSRLRARKAGASSRPATSPSASTQAHPHRAAKAPSSLSKSKMARPCEPTSLRVVRNSVRSVKAESSASATARILMAIPSSYPAAERLPLRLETRILYRGIAHQISRAEPVEGNRHQVAQQQRAHNLHRVRERIHAAHKRIRRDQQAE